MQAVLAFPLFLSSVEQYRKLAWLVGKGVDAVLLRLYWFPRVYGTMMVTDGTKLGKRFSDIYNAEGDITTIEGKVLDVTGNLAGVLGKINKGWATTNNESCFTIFGSTEHENMEIFQRYQDDFKSCYIHAPFQLDWYKVLWDNPDRSADSVPFFHASKYVRNTYTAALIHDFCVAETGGDVHHIAMQLFRPRKCQWVYVLEDEMTFDGIKSLLEEHGPMVILVDVPEELQKCRTRSYRGVDYELRDPTGLGHAMVVVGVRQEKATSIPDGHFPPETPHDIEKLRTCLLIQNFWVGCELFDMDLKYFDYARGELYYVRGKLGAAGHEFHFLSEEVCASPGAGPHRPRLFG